MYKAIVMAGGGRESLKTFNYQSSTSKSALLVFGRPMVSYVLDALRESKLVDKILYIGDLEVLSKISINVDYTIPDSGSLFLNVMKALEFFRDEPQVLILTSDIPLIKSYMIDDFLSKCDRSAIFCYSFVRKENLERLFPHAHRTYVRLKEGTFNGGNLILVNPSKVLAKKKLLERIISNRKNPLFLAKIFGLTGIIRYMTGTLDIPILEARASKILGGKVQAVLTEYPEVSFDVDNQLQLEFVEERLGKQVI
ncbi:MAG: NTP transferase domain-containing protein [bacterium]|nr:NTP transferase domain-containing protein [bacterium]